MNTIKFNHLLIEEKNENCYYITLGDWVIYIDASIEGEKIVSHWLDPEYNFKQNKISLNNTYKSSVIEY